VSVENWKMLQCDYPNGCEQKFGRAAQLIVHKRDVHGVVVQAEPWDDLAQGAFELLEEIVQRKELEHALDCLDYIEGKPVRQWRSVRILELLEKAGQ
jgi:hypothetical protein